MSSGQSSAGSKLTLVDVAPIWLSDGLRLFRDSLPEQRWNLKNVVAYKNGFFELSYSALSGLRTPGQAREASKA